MCAQLWGHLHLAGGRIVKKILLLYSGKYGTKCDSKALTEFLFRYVRQRLMNEVMAYSKFLIYCILGRSLHLASYLLYNIHLLFFTADKSIFILDFKLSPCYEFCILSFGCFPGDWILCASISEHSLPSAYVVWTRITTRMRLPWYWYR